MAERVFVSGEDGLLASTLVEQFRQAGHTIVNDAIPKTWQNPYRASGREVNVLDGLVLRLLAEEKPTIVVHAAALVNTDKCEADSFHAWRCNAETTFNMAILARDVGARLIYFSTTSVYDPWGSRPYGEGDRVRPYTIYGQTKYIGEEVCRRVYGDEGLLVLRPCFVYGGSRDTSSTPAKIAKAVLWHGSPVDVLLEPNFKKDYMWVDDFVQVASMLMSYRARGIYNVARGKPRKFVEVMNILGDILGHDEVKAKVNWRLGQDYLRDHIVEPMKAIKFTGIQPSVGLEEGLRVMVEGIK